MRIKEFQNILKGRGIGAAMLFSRGICEPSVFYFTGYTGAGCLIVPKKGHPVLAVPKMELQKARNSISSMKIFSLDKKRFLDSAAGILKKTGQRIKNIGLEQSLVSVSSFKLLKGSLKNRKFCDISEEIRKMRSVKTLEEIELLKKSCRHADSILQTAFENFSEFKTESDVSSFLEYQTKKFGMDVSFPPIVASGANSGIPHYEPKNEKLKKGFCVVDFGVRFKGYCSDITRTLFIGSPSKKERGIYSFVLNVQKNTVNEIKKNKKCSELYDFVNKELGKYKGYFTHGLGHGVGVEIHELPNLTLSSPDTIENGMVFTIEPGIYFPKKFGIRIEDTVLFNKDRTEILTKTSKDLLIV